MTGRYFHNLKTTGGGCMHIDEDKVNNQTFALYGLATVCLKGHAWETENLAKVHLGVLDSA